MLGPESLPHLMQHQSVAAMAAAAAEFIQHSCYDRVKSEVKHEPGDLPFSLGHYPAHPFDMPL
jgi:hypothetical protein